MINQRPAGPAHANGAQAVHGHATAHANGAETVHGHATVNGREADAQRMDGLVERVHRLLTEHLNLDAPSADTDIINSGALDSFTMVELLVSVEEQFGVEVAIETLDVDHFRSARTVAGLIAAQQDG